MKNYEKILRSLCERPPFVFRAHWDHEPRISETASPRCCRHLYLFTALPTLVAQTCSLLYRRFVTCGSPAKSRALGVTDAWPITNRRYGRLKICATVNRYVALATLDNKAEKPGFESVSTVAARRPGSWTVGPKAKATRLPSSPPLRGDNAQPSQKKVLSDTHAPASGFSRVWFFLASGAVLLH